MKAFFILLSAALSLQVAAAFANLAAVLQRAGSSWADTVGFIGIGVAAILFVAASIFLWRLADNA